MANEGGEQNPGGGLQPGAGGGDSQRQQADPAGGGQGGNAQPGAGAGAGGGEKVFTFKEDRTDWLPRHRLNEESTKRQKLEAEIADLRAKYDQEAKRVRALAGVDPQNPKIQEQEEIKEAILALFPQLKNLDQIDGDRLNQVLAAGEAATQTTMAAWSRHAAGMHADLFATVAKSINVDKLSPSQEKRLKSAYSEAAMESVEQRRAAMQRGDRQTLETLASDNDFLARHERGDKALLSEFAKAYLDDWFEPARKATTLSTVARIGRRVPRGERSQPVVGGAEKVDLSDPAKFKEAMLKARLASQD